MKLSMGILRFSWMLLVAASGIAAEPQAAPRADEKAGRVTVAAIAAKQGTYDVLKGAIEYVLVSRGGKDYETLFVTEAKPEEIQAACEKAGLRGGAPAGEDSPPAGAATRILVEYEADGKKVRRAVDELVIHVKSGKPLEAKPWVYTGSAKSVDPESGKETLQCAITKSVVGLHYTDGSPLFQNPRPEARAENIYHANLKELPPAGTAVTLVFERAAAGVAADTRRVRALLSGRLQGVGFEAFAQREARKLKLTGFVKRLADGRLEALIEGPGADVDKLLEKLGRGTRAAVVEGREVKEEKPLGDLSDFAIQDG